MNCDAAIFDLDGTILDSLWVWEDISKDFLSKKGKDIPVTYIQELCSKSFQEAAEYTIRLFMLSETSQEVISEWNRLALIEYKHNINCIGNVAASPDSEKSRGFSSGKNGIPAWESVK